VIRSAVHGVNGGKVYIVFIRIGAGISRRGKREGACGGCVDRVYPLNQPLVSVIQSDVTDVDDIQQRGFSIVQPGYRAWLIAVANPAGGRVNDV